MTEKSKAIRADIEKSVAHLARMHGVLQDEIWNEMYVRSSEEVKSTE